MKKILEAFVWFFFKNRVKALGALLAHHAIVVTDEWEPIFNFEVRLEDAAGERVYSLSRGGGLGIGGGRMDTPEEFWTFFEGRSLRNSAGFLRIAAVCGVVREEKRPLPPHVVWEYPNDWRPGMEPVEQVTRRRGVLYKYFGKESRSGDRLKPELEDSRK